MADPTYDAFRISENPVWLLAWTLSEIQNDNAPLGWGKHIHVAERLIAAGYSRTEGENDGLP